MGRPGFLIFIDVCYIGSQSIFVVRRIIFRRDYRLNYLKLDHEGEISIVTLNRPEKHNAFNLVLLKELETVFRQLRRENTRLVILTGIGEKSFCSGVDLSEAAAFADHAAARDFALQLEETMSTILQFPKPVIAAMNGHAFGGGYGLASSADIRILREGSKIGFPAVRLGAILPVGCTLRLTHICGAGLARELLLTGRVLTSEEALHYRLVNFVTGAGQILNKARELAAEILKGTDLALEFTKQVVNQPLLKEIQSSKLHAAENFAWLAMTRDWKERMMKALAE